MKEMKKCAGCGKERPYSVSQYEASELVEVEVSVCGDLAFVCQGRGESGASDNCLDRARHGSCPGCGKKIGYISGIRAPAMCETCRADLQRGGEAREVAVKEGRAFSFLQSGEQLLGASLWRGGNDNLGGDIARALTRVAGGRTEHLSGEPTHGYVPPVKDRYDHPRVYAVVETTKEQHEAFLELATLLRKAVEIIGREKFSEGNDLLGKLARHEIGISAYDDESVKRGPKRGE